MLDEHTSQVVDMLLDEHTFLVVDTETTGLEAPEHKAVEVAAVVVRQGRIMGAFTTLLNPERLIPCEVSAVHGLVGSDVAQAPTLLEALPLLEGFARLAQTTCLVAHNAPFDKSMLPGFAVGTPWLDTLRLARHLYPDMSSHKNQVLRYALSLECPEAAGCSAHRALADAYVTARLLIHMLGNQTKPYTLPELLDYAASPLLLPRCYFGKHKGMLWADIPKDYLGWVLTQNFDADIKFTAQHYLGAAGE